MMLAVLFGAAGLICFGIAYRLHRTRPIEHPYAVMMRKRVRKTDGY